MAGKGGLPNLSNSTAFHRRLQAARHLHLKRGTTSMSRWAVSRCFQRGRCLILYYHRWDGCYHSYDGYLTPFSKDFISLAGQLTSFYCRLPDVHPWVGCLRSWSTAGQPHCTFVRWRSHGGDTPATQKTLTSARQVSQPANTRSARMHLEFLQRCSLQPHLSVRNFPQPSLMFPTTQSLSWNPNRDCSVRAPAVVRAQHWPRSLDSHSEWACQWCRKFRFPAAVNEEITFVIFFVPWN